MILGLSVATFTLLHVLISLVGIATGLVALAALARGAWLKTWQYIFLVTTIATSVTGFFFHSAAIGPAHVVGVISLVVLAVSLLALWRQRTGPWRAAYAVSATIALYLNCFVGVVQAFQKVEPFRALAPTGTEPPFLVAQGLLLAIFVVWGVVLVRRPKAAIAAA